MRIVTRPDFDGIVCAVIILEAHGEELPVIWVEPGDVQSGRVDIGIGDIMANLPFDSRCSVWFDHHVSNSIRFEQYRSQTGNRQIEGDFRIAPSAAGVVYQYYRDKGKLLNTFDELVRETDIIDAAMLSMDQVLNPEKYPFILLSMTVKNREESDRIYWDRLVTLLRRKPTGEILEDTEVKRRCEEVNAENMAYADILRKHTTIHDNISITDFREFERAPSGNRFLTYSLFPDCVASVKIRYGNNDRNTVLLSVGKSIFKEGFDINIGKLLAGYGGGGHAGAGGCSMNALDAQKNIDEIIDIMLTNSNQAK